ncbi:MAG: hypothetical protein Kow0031_09100 [Anaerolineae bacterium]|jgi:hypothetical protein
MAKRARGRPQKIGTVYRFEFYYRYIPGEDPPELKALLDSIIAVRGRKRRDILRAALLGGAQQARTTADQVEDSDMTHLFEDMFADF